MTSDRTTIFVGIENARVQQIQYILRSFLCCYYNHVQRGCDFEILRRATDSPVQQPKTSRFDFPVSAAARKRVIERGILRVRPPECGKWKEEKDSTNQVARLSTTTVTALSSSSHVEVQTVQRDLDMVFVWHRTNLDTFVAWLHRNACMYDRTSADYSNRDLKRRACREIKQEIGITEDEIKKKIKSLRTKVSTYKNKVGRHSGAGRTSEADDFSVDADDGSVAYLPDTLHFLLDHVTTRLSFTNFKKSAPRVLNVQQIENSDTDDDSTKESLTDVFEKPSVKRRKTEERTVWPTTNTPIAVAVRKPENTWPSTKPQYPSCPKLPEPIQIPAAACKPLISKAVQKPDDDLRTDEDYNFCLHLYSQLKTITDDERKSSIKLELQKVLHCMRFQTMASSPAMPYWNTHCYTLTPTCDRTQQDDTVPQSAASVPLFTQQYSQYDSQASPHSESGSSTQYHASQVHSP